MAELSKGFPPDVTWSIPYDTTPFISLSIEEVVKTLVEPMLPVFLVLFLFLQHWPAPVIPTALVPIPLPGASIVLVRFVFPFTLLSFSLFVLLLGVPFVAAPDVTA